MGCLLKTTIIVNVLLIMFAWTTDTAPAAELRSTNRHLKNPGNKFKFVN